MTRWGALAAILVGACGGGDDGGGGTDAAAGPPDAATVPPGCVTEGVRSQKSLTVSATVIDFVTGEPVAGATVDVSTAWDVAGGFPDECPPIASFTSDAEGRVGPQLIEMGSVIDPPILVFMVHGETLTSTASDQTVNGCTGSDCGNLGHTITVPTRAVGDAWRTDLAAGGMADAEDRGLTVFEYRELDLSPAAGVVPNHLSGAGTNDLVPGDQVRFVSTDRTGLEPSDATVTTATGVAIIGVDTGAGIARVGGTRGNETWADIGVLLPPGWLFLEDRRVAP